MRKMRTMEALISFLADRKLMGVSPTTLKNHEYYGKRLAELSPQFPPKPEIIQQFLATVKPQYAATFYRYWHAFGNYAEKRWKIPNFMKSVTRPRIPKKPLPTISEAELNLLAWAIKTASDRDRAIITLFVDTAIRLSEAGLKRDDIKNEYIIVNGKTGYRIVPISEVARDLLLALPIHEDGYIFHGKGGKPLTKYGFYGVVKKFLTRIGYNKKHRGPQTIRRSFSRFWFQDGGDPKGLQMQLGHADIKTTMNHYVAWQAEDVIQIHHRHTPGRIFEEVK
jgi:integrase